MPSNWCVSAEQNNISVNEYHKISEYKDQDIGIDNMFHHNTSNSGSSGYDKERDR